MTKTLLLCLLFAALPGMADARNKHRDHAEQRAFRQEQNSAPARSPARPDTRGCIPQRFVRRCE
ncbi:hypothetical protein HND92_13485 [Diaphorobacter sp. JS3050]|uniref:hypothetical protein n=1 Tax=Diaphorobacter sp. JS3050 TaxID=2735554 RepID=UPI0015567D77|nr:hypothetical protein [Diaphorobacter sp. JS3050]QJY33878.1 hypothetical protein HND92_13485 [Diaphorobacter sp. JS3050]